MGVYYISASGSSGNTGASDAQSWPLSKLNSFEVAGDIILIKKGDTFNSAVVSITRSGSSGNPITYDIYGSSTNNPILDGAASTSAVISVTGSYLVFNNLLIQNSTNSSGLFRIVASGLCRDVTINGCAFNTGVRGVYIDSAIGNININNNYFTAISDPNIASNGGGNRVQFHTCTLTAGSCNVNGNKTYEPTTNAGIGDQFSYYLCFGTSSFSFNNDSNQIKGGNLTTGTGYNAFGLGDNGGSYQRVTNNIIVNPGGAAIIVSGGSNHYVDNNKVYSAANFASGAGIIYGAYNGAPPNTGVTISNNILNWSISTGPSISNFFWDTSNGNSNQPTGWTTNGSAGVANTSANSTMLPTPLFNIGDWNVTVIPVINYISNSVTYTNGVPIATNSVTVSSAYYPITSYSVSPGLPTGLSLNTSTGAITGTPSGTSASSNYTITATNIGGTGTAVVNITVAASSLISFNRKISFI